MNTNTCDTCKHWGPNRPAGEGMRKIASPYQIGECKNELLQCPAHYIIDNPNAAGIDYGVQLPFCTGPKFGCVHHEE